MAAEADQLSDMFAPVWLRTTPSGLEERCVNSNIGRGLFASCHFKKDYIIFEEDPLVSCQFLYNKEYGYSACSHCMRSLEDTLSNTRRLSQSQSLDLPYSQCFEAAPIHVSCPWCQEKYCSEECLGSAWRHYHKTLCHPVQQHPTSIACAEQHPLVLLKQEWKKHHFPPESMSVELVVRLLAAVCQSSEPARASAALAQFCHATARIDATGGADACSVAHKLLGNHFKQHIETLRHLMLQLFGSREVEQWLSPEGFLSLLALVATNGQGVASSPLARWVTRVQQLPLSTDETASFETFLDSLYDRLDSTVGSFLDTEGSGLYLMQSRLNHSCRPNSQVSFPHNSHRLVLTALRDIAVGDQITISYLDECILQRSRHSRQKFLSENYLFVCRCERCENEKDEQKDRTSSEEEEDEEDTTMNVDDVS